MESNSELLQVMDQYLSHHEIELSIFAAYGSLGS